MTIRQVQGMVHVDTDLDDGYVRVEGNRRAHFFMSLPTSHALCREGALGRAVEVLRDSRGTSLLPRAVVEPEAASDLRLGLSLVDPEPSEYCIYPPCSLPAEVVHDDGFPLCTSHAALMADWDHLTV